MRCNKCGADSRVFESREHPEKFMRERRRRCANEHTFVTFEIHQQVLTRIPGSSLAEVAQAAWNRINRYKRNMQIWVAYRVKKESAVGIAHEVGLDTSMIYNIVNEMDKERTVSATTGRPRGDGGDR